VRTLAIGDIHGCLRAFDLLLEQVDPQSGDVIVTLGDYVDRGPDSKGVLDRLLELRSQTKLVPLTGNHELMMLAARQDGDHFREWQESGGKQTLASYRSAEDWHLFSESIPARHWRFLEEGCQPYHEEERHFFVHANAEPDRSLQAQSRHALYWQSLEPAEQRPHSSGKTMICGHTAQRSGRPLVLDHAICIDTWAHGSGWLTCLEVDLEVYWQTNQRGETRLGNLSFRSR
jgi:Calcineurin-like phosphoesterase